MRRQRLQTAHCWLSMPIAQCTAANVSCGGLPTAKGGYCAHSSPVRMHPQSMIQRSSQSPHWRSVISPSGERRAASEMNERPMSSSESAMKRRTFCYVLLEQTEAGDSSSRLCVRAQDLVSRDRFRDVTCMTWCPNDAGPSLVPRS